MMNILEIKNRKKTFIDTRTFKITNEDMLM